MVAKFYFSEDEQEYTSQVELPQGASFKSGCLIKYLGFENKF